MFIVGINSVCDVGLCVGFCVGFCVGLNVGFCWVYVEYFLNGVCLVIMYYNIIIDKI